MRCTDQYAKCGLRAHEVTTQPGHECHAFVRTFLALPRGTHRALETIPHVMARQKKTKHYFHSVLKLGKTGYSAINNRSLKLMLLS